MRQDLFYLLVLFLAEVLRVLAFFADAFGWRRSGSTFLPVERFHSSYCWSVILPSTRSSANFRRCALLLNGTTPRRARSTPTRYSTDEGRRARGREAVAERPPRHAAGPGHRLRRR